MLNELITETITYLKAQLTDFHNRNVERYQNQFETNSTYTFGNRVAVCFIELLEATPVSLDAQKRVINKSYLFRALVGRDFEASELAETVFDALDGVDTTIDDRTFIFHCHKMFLVGWFGRTAVYELQYSAE